MTDTNKEKETFESYWKRIRDIIDNGDSDNLLISNVINIMKLHHDESITRAINQGIVIEREITKSKIKYLENQLIEKDKQIQELQAEIEILKQAHKDYVNKIINTFGSD